MARVLRCRLRFGIPIATRLSDPSLTSNLRPSDSVYPSVLLGSRSSSTLFCNPIFCEMTAFTPMCNVQAVHTPVTNGVGVQAMSCGVRIESSDEHVELQFFARENHASGTLTICAGRPVFRLSTEPSVIAQLCPLCPVNAGLLSDPVPTLLVYHHQSHISRRDTRLSSGLL